MENNEIIITHLVNPHYFYFRWVRDEGYDKDLSEIERKIENIVNNPHDGNSGVSMDAKSMVSNEVQSTASTTSNSSKIRIGSVVGVFLPAIHKYMRAVVKEEKTNDHYCLWAIDYGFPIVAKASNVHRLPKFFQGMNTQKRKRILKGGMENVMPAELSYDIAKGGVKEIIPNWCENATTVLTNVLKTSGKINFEHVSELINPIDKKPHYFGRLMIQRPDNEMVNAVKCLLDMNYGCLTEGKFADDIKTIETIDVKKHKNYQLGPQFLDMQLTIAPTSKLDNVEGNKVKHHDDGSDDDSFKDNMTEYLDENEYFDDSVSMLIKSVSTQLNVGAINQSQVKDDTKAMTVDVNANNSQKGSTHVSNNSSQQTPSTVIRRPNEHRNQSTGDRKTRNDQRQHQNNFNQRTPQLQQHQQPQLQSQHLRLPNQGHLFNRPPPLFNGPPYQFIPMQNEFIRQGNQGGRRRQVNRNRNHGMSQDGNDFAASFGMRPLERINENLPMAPMMMNPPFAHWNSLLDGVPRNEYNSRNIPNERRFNKNKRHTAPKNNNGEQNQNASANFQATNKTVNGQSNENNQPETTK